MSQYLKMKKVLDELGIPIVEGEGGGYSIPRDMVGLLLCYHYYVIGKNGINIMCREMGSDDDWEEFGHDQLKFCSSDPNFGDAQIDDEYQTFEIHIG